MSNSELEPKSPQPLRILILEGESGNSARCLDLDIEAFAPTPESAQRILSSMVGFHCRSLVAISEAGKLKDQNPERIRIAREVLQNGFVWES